ncbi:PAS domain-containing protein [Methylomonas sp. MgM2]
MFSSPHRLRHVLLIALILFISELAVAVLEQQAGAGVVAPLMHLTIAAAFLVLLVYSMRRFPINAPPESDINGLRQSRLPLPAILVNRQGRILSVNPAAARSVKLAPNAIINQPIHDLFHPPKTPREQCLICRHIRMGATLAATDFAIAGQNWQQISLNQVANGNTDLLIELHIDITRRKRNEEQMALVINSAGLGYWDWDYTTAKVQVNSRLLDMIGLDMDELDHDLSDWGRRIHPADREQVQSVIAKHIASNTPYTVEFRIRHKKGHWIWVQCSGAVAQRDPVSGRPVRLCGVNQDISARKRIENKLKTAYQVISRSPSVVFKWNGADGLPIEFATENASLLLEYSAEDLLKDKVLYLNLIHPEDRPAVVEELASCRDKPDCFEITHQPYRLVSRNGTTKWVYDHKVLSRNDRGEVIAYQGLVTDISRQSQQNSAIRNIISSARQKQSPLTLDNLTLLTAETLNADYTLIGEIRPDRTCRTLSFYPTSRSGDQNDYTMHPSIGAMLATGKICSYRHSVSQHFPGEAWLIKHDIEGFIGIPLQNDRQQTIGYVIAMYCHAIPDSQFAEGILKLFAVQITSELERTSAMKALETQKQRLVDAQSISHIGDWQWHWSDNRFSWSNEMYRITGTSRSVFIPSFASILTQLVHPDDRNLFKTALQNANTNDAIDFKHRIMSPEGEIRHVHQRGKVIHDDQNRAIGIQGTMQDITDRLETEERLLEAKQEAEKANRVKSEFLANMSHEIRTPMNAIVGLVELCLNSPINAKQREYLERTETAAHSLMSLINDILDFTKMESGKLSLDSVPFVLEDMLDQVFSTMAGLCNGKRLTLIRPTINLPYQSVIGDPQRLRQVLINLIGNAIKFTHQGQISVTLQELDRTNRQTTLEFSISDTGIGMSQAQQDKLFHAFTQGDNSVSRHYGGTGLGLVISKQLIEQMGGTIKVSSQENIGSCFSFTVKLGITDTLYRPEEPVKYFDTVRFQTIRNARILLVEDNEVNRIVATELLAQAQLQVDTAENGEIALSKLRQNQYDCVLMDLQMPVMDGYQTVHKLRKLSNCTSIPVIAMTANVMSDDRKRCLQAGMDDFIGKPILPATLYAALIKWIKPERMSNTEFDQFPELKDDIPYLYGIDHSIGLLHTAEDKSVFRNVLRKFAENHIDDMDEIGQALYDNNKSLARQLVHTLKGLAGSIGAVQLQGHLIRLEELLLQTDANATLTSKLVSLATVELSRIIHSIQTSLPGAEVATLKREKSFSAAETKHQLEILLDKLQAFDSDADQQLELVLANTTQSSLTQELNRIKNQIADYQFVDAANALKKILDFRTNTT